MKIYINDFHNGWECSVCKHPVSDDADESYICPSCKEAVELIDNEPDLQEILDQSLNNFEVEDVQSDS